MENMVTNKGVSLLELSESGKVLLVFLRQFGCTFCRETLSELLALREEIENEDTEIVLVHQMNDEYAEQILNIYHLNDLHRISDPGLHLYDYFHLKRGTWSQVFGFKVWWRAIVAGIFKGHLIGKEQGDGWQMPGVFVIKDGEVVSKFIHKYASDRPDYLNLAKTKIRKAVS